MHKVAFTKEDDALLMKYIATYNPQLKGRLGTKLYEKLVENAERKWSFSSRHTVQSWREHYKNNQPSFDAQILRYQEKHGISTNSSENTSSRAPAQSKVRKTLPAHSNPPTHDTSSSIAPVNKSRAKKRLREVDPENSTLDSGIAKKARREKVSFRGNQPCNPPPHTSSRPPSEEPQNGVDGRAEFPRSAEDEATQAIGPDDYTGALSGSGESDQGAESPCEGKGISPSNKVEVKTSVVPTKSPNPSPVDATSTSEVSSLSQQQRDLHPEAVATEPLEFVRMPVDAPVQLSQEPTPPHTSAISSPHNPLPSHPSPMSGAPMRNGVGPRYIPSASLRRRRNLSSPRKRSIVPREEDDIFSTPPPQAVRENPPPRARGREPPRLVEGPFRSAYTNASSASQLIPRGRHASGTDEEEEADGENEDWPPRRGKWKSPIFSEGLMKRNLTPAQEHKQSTAEAQQQCPSNTLYAPDAIPAGESRPIAKAVSAAEPTIPDENALGFTSSRSQTKVVPMRVAQVGGSVVGQISKGAYGPPQSNTTPSPSQDQVLSNPERRPSHGFVQAKHQAPATNRNRLLFPVVSAHDLPPPVPGPPSKRASLNQNPNSVAHSVDDPFTAPLAKRKTRRQTFAGEREISRVNTRREKLVRRAPVQHIDLRALYSSRSVGSSLIGSATSLGHNSSGVKTKRPRRPPSSSTPPNLSESNKELVLALGLEAVYSRMAENHRFHIDVVREVAARQPSLEDADRVLRNMREAAGREYARLLRRGEATYSTAENETEESEKDEEVADVSGDDDDNQPVRHFQASVDSNLSPTSLIPQRRGRLLGLKISPESPDSSPTRPPHYSPPTPTRAHEFRRLERQGRGEEARLREARRVRRSHRPNSADESAEVDEQRIVAYLLQLQEDDTDGDPSERPRDVNEPRNEPRRSREQIIEPDIHEDEGPSMPPGLERHADVDAIQDQGSGFAEEQVDADEVIAANECQTHENSSAEGSRCCGSPGLDRECAAQAPSSPACSAVAALSLLDAAWTNSDDELLLDGDLVAHEELVRRKGISSVKFRTAHLYGLLLDG